MKREKVGFLMKFGLFAIFPLLVHLVLAKWPQAEEGLKQLATPREGYSQYREVIITGPVKHPGRYLVSIEETDKVGANRLARIAGGLKDGYRISEGNIFEIREGFRIDLETVCETIGRKGNYYGRKQRERRY